MQHIYTARQFKARRLFLESLEGRQLMAADFTPAITLEGAADFAINATPGVEETSGSERELPETHVLPGISESDRAAAVTDAVIGGLAAALSPLTSIPALNSMAGAAVSLYLDFNGHFDSVWGAYKNISTPVFDQDGDATSFNAGELTTIQKIWAQVSEDFSPFNINVTTVEPPSFANGVAVRAAIGGDGSWLGGGAGGVAYINSFTNSVVNTVYVFPKALSNGYAKYVAEATSHEAGHGFGLEHQSVFSTTGTVVQQYNSGTSALAPIMGNSYSATRGVWWNGRNGEYVMQDDMSVLSRAANGFGYRVDDHGNTLNTATALVAANNSVSAGGIVHQTTDVDYFSFTTGAGQVSFSVTVPSQINNLDARIELRNALGTLIASAAPTTSFGASITATVPAGSYRVVVASQGNYGDVGQYTLNGTIVPVAITTIAAPTNPDVTVGSTGIALTWTDQANQQAAVHVERRINGGTWMRVGTTTIGATSFVDSLGLAGDTLEYRVQATINGAVSSYSNVDSVTFAPSAPSGLVATATSGTQVSLSWSNVPGETGYEIDRYAGGVWTQIGTTAANVTTFQDTAATAGASYQYRVRAVNAGGESANSIVASVTTPSTLTRPAAPTALIAIINANRQVQLSWKDNATNEAVYVVQRSTTGTFWTTLGQVPANSTGAIDTSAARGRAYYYRVYAYNSAGASAYSNTARVVTPVLAARTTYATPINVPTIKPYSSAPSSTKTTAQTVGNSASTRVTTAKSATSDKPVYGLLASQSASQVKPATEVAASDWSSAVDAVLRSWLR